MSAVALRALLVKIGAEEEQAEEAVKDLVFSNNMATKTDLVEVKSELKESISELRVEISRLRAEMSSLETKLLRWNVILAGVVIAAVGLITKL